MSDNFNKGNEYFQNQQYEKAIECYDKVINIKPNDFRAYTCKCVVLSELKETKQLKETAIQLFEKCSNIPYEYSINVLNSEYKESEPLISHLDDDTIKDIIKKMIQENSTIHKEKITETYQYMRLSKETLIRIKDGEIGFTDILGFNDPMDPILKTKFTHLIKPLPLKIACLSSKKDSTLMWSHYADKHKGVCIEYDLDTIGEEKLITKLISYDSSLEYIKDKNTIGIIDKKEDFFPTDNVPTLLDTFFYKHKNWEYEKEIRVLLYDDSKDSIIRKKCEIKAIYLGMKMSDEHKQLVENIVEIYNKDKEENKKIKIFEMVLNETKLFKLKPIEL